MKRILNFLISAFLVAGIGPASADIRDAVGNWSVTGMENSAGSNALFSDGSITISESGTNVYVTLSLGEWWAVDKVFSKIEDTNIYTESTGWLARMTAGETPVAEVLKRGDPAIWMREVAGGLAIYEATILSDGMFDMKLITLTQNDSALTVKVTYSTGLEDTVTITGGAQAQ